MSLVPLSSWLLEGFGVLGLLSLHGPYWNELVPEPFDYPPELGEINQIARSHDLWLSGFRGSEDVDHSTPAHFAHGMHSLSPSLTLSTNAEMVALLFFQLTSS